MTPKTQIIEELRVKKHREVFEKWYSETIQKDADFQVGRDYEDNGVCLSYQTWEAVLNELTARIRSLIPAGRE
jgi:hypothetical protein